MNFSLFKKRRIYADWAATTPIHPRVAKEMKRAMRRRGAWANPSAIYREGVEARKALEERRAQSARLIGVRPEEVYFTSGGTEANATIIQGVLRIILERKMDHGSFSAENVLDPASDRRPPALRHGSQSHVSPGIRRDAEDKSGMRPGEGRGPGEVHVVASAIEHSSILETLKLFESYGVKVTYVNSDKNGIVQAEEVLKAITPATALVTVMYANNEIGTVQPVSKIGAGIRKMRSERLSDFPIFHTDASQAPLWLSCEIEGLRADAMTLDAHKMQGPKGVGALIVRRHVLWEPLMVGGGQERGKRPTTESLELITGFTGALELAQNNRKERSERILPVQTYLVERLRKEIPDAVVNGSLEKRLPNNINLSLPELSDPELAVLHLDKEGIACSTKSSCLKGEEDSYVVKSLGGERWRARNTLRFSLAPNTTMRDVDIIMGALRRLPG